MVSPLSRPNVLGSKPHSWVWSVAIFNVKPTRKVLVQIHFKLKLYHIRVNNQHLFPHILGADDVLQKRFHFRTLIGCPGMQCVTQTMWSPALTAGIRFLNNSIATLFSEMGTLVWTWKNPEMLPSPNQWPLDNVRKEEEISLFTGFVVVLGQGWVCMHVFIEIVCTSKQYRDTYVWIKI